MCRSTWSEAIQHVSTTSFLAQQNYQIRFNTPATIIDGAGCFLRNAKLCNEPFFDFKKIPQPVGETALQPTAFVATKPWRTPRFGEVKRKKRKWKIKNGKMELRSPRDTEADEEVADVAVDAVGRAVGAPRRAAAVGVGVPAAAAQQTIRASRGSCGVCHES